jgi:flavodoxin I
LENQYPSLFTQNDGNSSWYDGVELLKEIALSEKKVAIFGTGDSLRFSETFCDAVGILYEALKEKGAEVVGSWPVTGYNYVDSRAERDGVFVGLVIDEDNESNLTEERVKTWVECLKSSFQ